MTSVGMKKVKILLSSAVLCHHILSCLINIIKKFLNLETITETKLFGEILADSCVWQDLETLMVKCRFGTYKQRLKSEFVNQILLLIVNGHTMIVN